MSDSIAVSADTVARMVFALEWSSPEAKHRELIHVPRCNFWRDILPGDMSERLQGMEPGGSVQAELDIADGLPLWRKSGMRTLEARSFQPKIPALVARGPQPGRFYPQGVLQGLPSVYPQTATPFRVLESTPDTLLADFNHPMAPHTPRGAQLTAQVLEVKPKHGDTGGQCRHVVESILNWGPGMQARRVLGEGSAPTVFAVAPEDMGRADENEDGFFYANPRVTAHVDTVCQEQLGELYQEIVPQGARVLDLMAGSHSHLRPDHKVGPVTGLGMNAQEMDANPALANHVVHDLNRDPKLAFDDNSFDAVLCTVSVEYLTDPRAVFADVARVLAPGGVFAVTFSNRWFPAKAARLWTELHEFERMGFVLDLFLENSAFEDLRTHSARGWPRPWDPNDRYVDRLKSADPLFGVWGRRKG